MSKLPCDLNTIEGKIELVNEMMSYHDPAAQPGVDPLASMLYQATRSLQAGLREAKEVEDGRQGREGRVVGAGEEGNQVGPQERGSRGSQGDGGDDPRRQEGHIERYAWLHVGVGGSDGGVLLEVIDVDCHCIPVFA